MDKTDQMILDILQTEGRIPLKRLAERVHLSSPAASARMERLEREGYITGYRAVVDRAKLGFHITAFVNIEMEPERKREFSDFARGCPNVLECAAVTGEYSMLVKVAFRSTEELDSFVGKLQRYGRTSTQVVFSTPVEARGITSAEALSE
ncbi:MAG: Lrp/AsnC family transcriptional regulator [Oscillospiraceae bacterium]